MRNIKIIMEYDGTDFYGWQIQPERRTVQGLLESALETFLNKKTKVTGAGRTDTGVHALNQVANFHMNGNYDEETIKNAINANLPCDISIKNVEKVDNSFNSRFDAISRIYIYRISKIYSVFNNAYSWHYGYTLDVYSMNKGCRLLLGENDMTSFTVAKSKKENMYMDIKKCHFMENEDEIVFEIEADRFLHKSVRTIVGTLTLLGKSKLDVSEIRNILLSKDRGKAGSTAPPNGLFLKEVKY